MRPGAKSNEFEHWKYVLFYADDVLRVSGKSNETLQALNMLFKLKDDAVEEPHM